MRYFHISQCASGCSVSHSSPGAAHTFSFCQPSGDHGPGARDSQSRHHHAPGQEGRLFAKESPLWRGNVDSAVWTVRRSGCTEPESERGPIHFHMLFLDGVYVDRHDGSTRFRWVSSPTTQELTQLSQTIARRVGRYLERQGLQERDAENSYLTTDAVAEDPMNQLLGHSMM